MFSRHSELTRSTKSRPMNVQDANLVFADFLPANDEI